MSHTENFQITRMFVADNRNLTVINIYFKKSSLVYFTDCKVVI